MNQLRATALRLLTSAALSSGAGCQPALRSTHATDVPPAACYHLQFGPWSAAYQAPFAKAAAGLVSPVPDTITRSSSHHSVRTGLPCRAETAPRLHASGWNVDPD